MVNKDYLSEKEAAEYACVSYHQFRAKAKDYGLLPFSWMGKRVYRISDVKQAMEKEAAKQHGILVQKR